MLFTNCAVCDNGLSESQCKNTKQLIKELKKYIEKNLFNAPNNVILDRILGYKQEGEYHSYYDNYEEKELLLII